MRYIVCFSQISLTSNEEIKIKSNHRPVSRTHSGVAAGNPSQHPDYALVLGVVVLLAHLSMTESGETGAVLFLSKLVSSGAP